VAHKKNHPCHSEARFIGEESALLPAEKADSSHDNTALRDDNSLGIFKLHHYASLGFTAVR
jgi:hypothetical protein